MLIIYIFTQCATTSLWNSLYFHQKSLSSQTFSQLELRLNWSSNSGKTTNLVAAGKCHWSVFLIIHLSVIGKLREWIAKWGFQTRICSLFSLFLSCLSNKARLIHYNPFPRALELHQIPFNAIMLLRNCLHSLTFAFLLAFRLTLQIIFLFTLQNTGYQYTSIEISSFIHGMCKINWKKI